jgi:hypothetical protein
VQLAGRADWALMIAIHDALRRDLDQLLQAHRTRHLMPAVTGYGG